MITDKLIIIQFKSTGRQYAYPISRYSELPTVRIEDGAPGHTNFSRSELKYMEQIGAATRLGTAMLALKITYEQGSAAISKALGEE